MRRTDHEFTWSDSPAGAAPFNSQAATVGKAKLVYLVYLVYLVCLVDPNGKSSKGTRETRQTG
jgi:hypothetical protein